MSHFKTGFRVSISTAILLLTLSSAVFAAGRLSASLASLAGSSDKQDSLVQVVVFMNNQEIEDHVARLSSIPDMDRATRLKAVTNRLKTYRSTSLDQVEQLLKAHSSTEVKRHWIIPSFTATIPVSQLSALSAIDGVDQIVLDEPIEVEKPVSSSAAPSAVSTAISHELEMLNVPAVWQSGLNGKGRLVCNFDTGVEGTHPALTSKWRGRHASLGSSWFSVVAPDSQPYDKAGHGTHTMGTMIGSTDADSFGVAPGAEWIAAGVVDQGGDLNTTFSQILAAFEWALNPDGDTATTDDVPDVILNSWGVPTIQPSALAPCSTLFWQAIDNVEAAGIVTIFSAGNEGRYGSMTLRNPANRATTPYNCFSVGAVDGNSVIATFSSRGPSNCDTTQIKPEIVAPGVSIRSSTKGGGYAYMSGTSMAAPAIAGLVAICRQYNPDATPDQIKYAIMQSAVDLGNPGEDNDYGWGLPNAVKMISLLPVPSSYHLVIARQIVLGDGIVHPGQTVHLNVMLSNASSNLVQATGILTSSSSDLVTVSSSTATFTFGDGGSTALSSTPFALLVSDSAINGTKVPMWLHLYAGNGNLIDSLKILLTVGYPTSGTSASVNTGRITFTISDFGQYGLASGSIYNLGGQGFRYDGGSNLLYEAGIMVGRNSLQLSRAIRDSLGQFRQSDFRAIETMGAEWSSSDGTSHRYACMDDGNASVSIPMVVRQEVIWNSLASEAGSIIMSYTLVNNTLERQTGIRFGSLYDFDLSAGADQVHAVEGVGLVYQRTSSGPLVGLVAIDNKVQVGSLANGTSKRGFSKEETFGLLTSSVSVDSFAVGDMMLLMRSGAFDVNAGDSATIRFALVAADDVDGLVSLATKVRQLYSLPTDVDEPTETLPADFALNQNYPNPFNPSTTIEFALGSASDVRLEVFDCLGRSIRMLADSKMAAGQHSVVWDGRDQRQHIAATGVYFYRLTVDGHSASRKMLLLK